MSGVKVRYYKLPTEICTISPGRQDSSPRSRITHRSQIWASHPKVGLGRCPGTFGADLRSFDQNSVNGETNIAVFTYQFPSLSPSRMVPLFLVLKWLVLLYCLLRKAIFALTESMDLAPGALHVRCWILKSPPCDPICINKLGILPGKAADGYTSTSSLQVDKRMSGVLCVERRKCCLLD